jgi:hypothetical protein
MSALAGCVRAMPWPQLGQGSVDRVDPDDVDPHATLWAGSCRDGPRTTNESACTPGTE